MIWIKLSTGQIFQSSEEILKFFVEGEVTQGIRAVAEERFE